MPFITLHTSLPSVFLGLWRIDEDEGYFLDRLNIYENEQRILASISHPLKRLEWLSSRLCLKELLDIRHKVESLNRQDGKPYLSDGSSFISYSHSNRVSGAIASTRSWVSIDIEDLTKPRNPETRRLFMHPDELRVFDALDDLRVFFLFWSAKETLYKIHPERGLVFKENLLLSFGEEGLQQKGTLRGLITKDGISRTYEVMYEFFQDVVLTYTHDPVLVRQPIA